MQARIADRPASVHRREGDEHRLSDGEQNRRPADENLALKRQRNAGRQQRAELLHMPVRRKGHREIEEERRRNEAQRLEKGQAAPPDEQRAEDPGEIDGVSDRPAGDVEKRNVLPRSWQLPEANRVVSRDGENGEGRGVDDDQPPGAWRKRDLKTPQRQSGGAEEGSGAPGLIGEGGPYGGRDERCAAGDEDKGVAWRSRRQLSHLRASPAPTVEPTGRGWQAAGREEAT